MRLIADVSGESVTQLLVQDVFTDDFDVYYCVTNHNGFSGNTALDLRFLDGGQGYIDGSNYSYARYLMYAHTGFSESKSTTSTVVRGIGEVDDEGINSNFYIYNPTNENVGTYLTTLNAGFSSSNASFNMVAVSMLNKSYKISGFALKTANGGTLDNINCQVYGIRNSL